MYILFNCSSGRRIAHSGAKSEFGMRYKVPSTRWSLIHLIIDTAEIGARKRTMSYLGTNAMAVDFQQRAKRTDQNPQEVTSQIKKLKQTDNVLSSTHLSFIALFQKVISGFESRDAKNHVKIPFPLFGRSLVTEDGTAPVRESVLGLECRYVIRTRKGRLFVSRVSVGFIIYYYNNIIVRVQDHFSTLVSNERTSITI